MAKLELSNILYPIPAGLGKLIDALGNDSNPPAARIADVVDYYYAGYSDIINSFYESAIGESRSLFWGAWAPELLPYVRWSMHRRDVTENDFANEVYDAMALFARQIMTNPTYAGQTQATVDVKFSSIFHEIYIEKFDSLRDINRNILSKSVGW